MAEKQRETAANIFGSTWTEEDVLRVERGDEKLPRSVDELFNLVRSHVEHVARLVENDDFSYRRLFVEGTLEREIQLWVASCLRERSRGLYSVVRENMVDDDKEVDISAFSAGVGHVPIEIKPAERYTYQQLVETIEDQLLGRYMQPPDRKYGVLLLACLRDKSWKVDGRSLKFAGLVDALQAQASEIGAKHGKVIRVEAVDMREQPLSSVGDPSAKADATKPKKRRSNPTKRGPTPAGRTSIQ